MLPPSIEEYIPEDHPVRVIDAFVESLDVIDMGFDKTHTADTDRRPAQALHLRVTKTGSLR